MVVTTDFEISDHNETDDEPLRRIPPLLGNAFLRIGTETIWVEGAMEAAAKQDRLSAADKADARIGPGGTPAFTVYHVRLGLLADDWIEAQNRRTQGYLDAAKAAAKNYPVALERFAKTKAAHAEKVKAAARGEGFEELGRDRVRALGEGHDRDAAHVGVGIAHRGHQELGGSGRIDRGERAHGTAAHARVEHRVFGVPVSGVRVLGVDECAAAPAQVQAKRRPSSR